MNYKILFCILFLCFIACDNTGTQSETYSVINNSNLDEEKIESVLQNYLDALINGDKEIISQMHYSDIKKHFNKYSSRNDKLEDVIEEHMVKPALVAKKRLEEEGITQYYKIERKIGEQKINDYTISSFLVTKNLTLGDRALRDTIRMIAFNSGSKIEFMSASEGAESILSYRFDELEINQILQFAFEGKYGNLKKKINRPIFQNYDWKLEAIGSSQETLRKYNAGLKGEIISIGLGDIPENMMFSNGTKFDLYSVSGDKRRVELDIKEDYIYGIDNPHGNRYDISESGIGLYYFDLFVEIINEEIVFVYKGYPFDKKRIVNLDSFYVERSGISDKKLIFTTNKLKYNLYEYVGFMAVDEIRDYDNNGFKDALFHTNIGGICCPESSYYLVLNYGEGYTKILENFHLGFYDHTEEWKDHLSIVIDDDYSGSSRNRYIVQDENVVLVEERSARSLVTLKELNSSDFTSAYDEYKRIMFDLDNDGIDDTIQARTNYNMSLVWSVYFTSKQSYAKFQIHLDEDGNRLGVIESETNGIHDLVFNKDVVFKWDGEKYIIGNKERFKNKY